MAGPEVNGWLILAYRLPAEPSRKRVLVWRHLRKLGAIYLETGIWLVPRREHTAKEAKAVLDEIEELGGAATAFVADDLSPTQTLELQAKFNRVRQSEYADLLDKCRRFLSHIERLAKGVDFRFANVEELEEDLEKRRRTLAQVIERDVFDVGERHAAEAGVKDCEEALARFTEQAFAANKDGLETALLD